MAVQDIICTSTSKLTLTHNYQWTIEKISLLPDELRGPSVNSIPGFEENLYIELHFKQGRDYVEYHYVGFDVLLVDIDGKDSHTAVVSSCTSLCDTKGNILKIGKTSSTEFKGNINLLDYTHTIPNDEPSITKLELPTMLSLLDDKLIVKGMLSISVNNLPTSSLKARTELSHDFKTMYESGISSDINFLVGGKTLCAHKSILLGRSPVFARMFNNDMLESNTKKVFIEDTDFHAFNCFLMFLYTGIVDDKKWDTVFSLYTLAHKYQVNSLHSICSGILGKMLTIDSVCSVLMLSDLYGDKKLKDVAIVFICDHFNQVAFTPEWIEITVDNTQLTKEVQTYMASQTTKK